MKKFSFVIVKKVSYCFLSDDSFVWTQTAQVLISGLDRQLSVASLGFNGASEYNTSQCLALQWTPWPFQLLSSCYLNWVGWHGMKNKRLHRAYINDNYSHLSL